MGRSRKVTEAPAPKEEQPAVEVAENVPVKEGSALPETCIMTDTSLIITDSITEADWIAMGAPLANVKRATPFYIGDWLTFGQNKNFIQSDKYDHAEKVTGMRRSTLKLYAFVSRNVPPLVRTNGLSFAHHQLVASLSTEEQTTWLAKAKGLTVKRFRTFLQTYAGNVPVPRKRTLKMVKKQLDLVIKDCRDLPGLEAAVKAIDEIQTGS